MFYRFNFYPFIWAICMFGLNFVRLDGVPSHHIVSFLYFDKIIHFTQFFILSFMLCVGMNKQHTYVALKFKAMQVALISSIVYACVLSSIHWHFAKEYFEITDLLAALLGCLVGTGIFYLIYKYKIED